MKKIITGLALLLCLECFPQHNPSVEFTFLPDWGNTSLLRGKVHNTSLADHGIAVYIYIEEAGGWWVKPTSSDPVSNILADSAFSTNIVTGGIDQYATQVIAFLIPKSFSPPVLSGEDLPSSMFDYPYTVQCRPHGSRTISWSGFDWTVKRSIDNGPSVLGPGPNIFNDNDSMVWVDNRQRLHLRIAKHGNEWHCTELICKSSEGYNQYAFDIDGRVDLLDPNVITGIFTWDDCSTLVQSPNKYYREIDIEFSRWGDPSNINSQFVIQPWDKVGNINRYNMNLNGLDHSIHYFNWTPDTIYFKSIWGDNSHSWKYYNKENLPLPGSENLRINLWLYNGRPPTDNMNAELVMNSFLTGISAPGTGNGRISIYPNPVGKGCMIDFDGDSREYIEAGIISLQGRLVKKLFSGKPSTGPNRIVWNGEDGNAVTASPGLYLVYFREKSGTRYFKIIKL